MDQEIQVSNSQRGQGAARADIVVWRSKEDKDGKALSAEYLHGQQIISEPFCIHRRLRNRIRGLMAA